MLQLVGGTHFLVLRTDEGKHFVHCFRRFDEALQKQDGKSRLSPIFAVEGSPEPSFPEGHQTYLFFFGPVYPGQVDVPLDVHAFLTLGLLNILFFCTTDQALQKVQELVCDPESRLGGLVSVR